MKTLPTFSTTEQEALAVLRKHLEEKLPGVLFKMVVFGSKARGDADEHSDLDVAIIVDEMDRALKNKILDVVADVEFEFLRPISALVLSLKELEFLRSRERRIAFDIDHEGVVV